jgi:hypothetical protein
MHTRSLPQVGHGRCATGTAIRWSTRRRWSGAGVRACGWGGGLAGLWWLGRWRIDPRRCTQPTVGICERGGALRRVAGPRRLDLVAPECVEEEHELRGRDLLALLEPREPREPARQLGVIGDQLADDREHRLALRAVAEQRLEDSEHRAAKLAAAR